MRLRKLMITLVLLPLSFAVCRADNFSFTGQFTNANDVQQFNFAVGSSVNNVVLRSWSYAGGVNAAGQTIAAGGFDPILALFRGTGPSATLLNQNDDGPYNLVAPDPVTGKRYDTYLAIRNLTAGSYTATIQDYANFAFGPTLDAGFTGDGSFVDRTGHTRTNAWAFDVDGVNAAVTPYVTPAATPEPSSWMLLGTGVLGMAGALRRRVSARRNVTNAA